MLKSNGKINIQLGKSESHIIFKNSAGVVELENQNWSYGIYFGFELSRRLQFPNIIKPSTKKIEGLLKETQKFDPYIKLKVNSEINEVYHWPVLKLNDEYVQFDYLGNIIQCMK